MKTTIRIGTRKSQLAMVQTNIVVDNIKELHPDINIEIIPMSTTGDKILDKALSKIGEKSLFTRELEEALERNVVDAVVHSLKDLPTKLPEGMAIAAICKREDPSDAVIMHPKYEGFTLDKLPQGSIIGTSSVRRIAQLQKAYPHLQYENVRGNLNTRFTKLDKDEKYAALILATAGVTRMGWSSRISQRLLPEVCMHAVGQGAIAIEVRNSDTETQGLLSHLNDEDTMLCCLAERAFMKTLEGGCNVPVAVTSSIIDGKVTLTGGVFSLDGSRALVDSLVSVTKTKNGVKEVEDEVNPDVCCGLLRNGIDRDKYQANAQIGILLAECLLKQGAQGMLSEIRNQSNK